MNGLFGQFHIKCATIQAKKHGMHYLIWTREKMGWGERMQPSIYCTNADILTVIDAPGVQVEYAPWSAAWARQEQTQQEYHHPFEQLQ